MAFLIWRVSFPQCGEDMGMDRDAVRPDREISTVSSAVSPLNSFVAWIHSRILAMGRREALWNTKVIFAEEPSGSTSPVFEEKEILLLR